MLTTLSRSDLAGITGGNLPQPRPVPAPPLGEPRLDIPAGPTPVPQPPLRPEPWLPVAPSPLAG